MKLTVFQPVRILPYFMEPNFRHSVQNSPPNARTIRQIYRAQTLPHYVHKIRFNIILPFMPRSTVFPKKNVCLRANCPAPLVVTSPQSNGTANPHDHNIQCVLCFVVQVSLKTFFSQKSFSELGSGCEQKRVQVFNKSVCLKLYKQTNKKQTK